MCPVIKSRDLQRSLQFYTEILDFERRLAGHEDPEIANGVIELVRDGAELQLSRHSGDGVFGSVNRVFVDNVDERYETFRRRGLNTTQRPESPIHTAPVDQTWGLREFAVTDPDGNGLCLCMPLKITHRKPRSVEPTRFRGMLATPSSESLYFCGSIEDVFPSRIGLLIECSKWFQP